MNPVGLTFTIVACIAVLLLPRRYAFVPVILATCYITQGQQVEIFDAHFTTIRITVLVGFIRVLIRGELRQVNILRIDKIFIFWVISGTIIYLLLRLTGEALIYRLGLTYDALLTYFFFRSIFRDLQDVKNVIPMLAILIVPLALLLLYERFGLRNVFSYFGAVGELPIFDGDRIRAMGPFRHPILAGSVGAALLPLFLALWFDKKVVATVGSLAAILMVIASNSSGPVLSAACAVLALALWPMRANMQLVRWGTVTGLVALHFYMKDPVWFVLARLGEIMGGTGWHRSYLIDRAIYYFDEWWLLGTKDTSYWMPTNLIIVEGSDITNQFIYEGVRGGLLTMLLFIALIAIAFSMVGKKVKAMKDDDLSSRFMVWALGASLFSHTASFLSVAYFDQTIVFLYLALALIGTIIIEENSVKELKKSG